MSKELDAQLAHITAGTTGDGGGGNARHGQGNVPSKLTNAALDAAADAAQRKNQRKLERAAARADADTKRRVG